MANQLIPKQALGNVTVFKESVFGTTLTAPPMDNARWVGIHNIHDSDISIFVPKNEVFESFAEDAVSRSAVYNPGNSGKLDENQDIITSSTVTDGTTATGDTSDATTLVVTRNGVDVTKSVTKPTFDGITVADGVVTAIKVNAEGANLEQGDVITFTCTTATDVDIQITVAEDDLQLSAGIYARKATTAIDIHTLGAGEIFYGSFSKIYVVADDGDTNGIVSAYFN